MSLENKYIEIEKAVTDVLEECVPVVGHDKRLWNEIKWKRYEADLLRYETNAGEVIHLKVDQTIPCGFH